MSQILGIFEFKTSDVKILNSIWRLAMSKNQNTLISGHRKSKNEQLTIPYSTTKIKLTKGGQTVKMKRKYAGVAELADAHASRAYESNLMRVQLPPPARNNAKAKITR